MSVKQVIVVRTDLKMSPGKAGIQIAHAAGMFLYDAFMCGTLGLLCAESRKWIVGDKKKIALEVNSQEELLAIYEEASRCKLQAHLVIDNGLTEIEPGTMTCVAIGPNECEKIDAITKHLKLYKGLK